MVPLSYNLRSLLVRRTTTIATASGVAMVVLVLSSAMMLVNGIKQTFATSGQPDNAIVYATGSDSEMMSMIEEPAVQKVIVQPQVKKDGAIPLAVAETVQVIQLERAGEKGVSNVTIRGVPDNGVAFRPAIKIVQGKMPTLGAAEVMVGKKMFGKFKGLKIGESVELRKNHLVKVVGVFEDGGSSYESEVWGSLDVVRNAFHFDGTVSTVRVRLSSAAALDGFKATVEHDKQLGFQVARETDYYEKQSDGLATLMTVLGTAISVFFSIVAMIGAMITMYGSVASRKREIGTLRALGFPKSDILISFLFEAITLTVAGGAVGAAASVAMKFVTFSMMGAGWSEVIFTFHPTPEILVKALAAAILMGLFGGLLPAVRAARTSTSAAMRGA